MTVSPTRNELLDNLVNYVNAATALPLENIIRGKQNAPSPLDNYCSILYVTDTPNGTITRNKEPIPDTSTLLYKLRGWRFYTFSVQFYRTGAADFARELLMFHETPPGQLFIQTSLFTIKKIENISEAAVILSQNYEERAVLNVDLNVSETQEFIVDAIENIDVNFTYAQSDAITISEDVEIP